VAVTYTVHCCSMRRRRKGASRHAGSAIQIRVLPRADDSDADMLPASACHVAHRLRRRLGRRSFGQTDAGPRGGARPGADPAKRVAAHIVCEFARAFAERIHFGRAFGERATDDQRLRIGARGGVTARCDGRSRRSRVVREAKSSGPRGPDDHWAADVAKGVDSAASRVRVI
jgi:hypothetical protein